MDYCWRDNSGGLGEYLGESALAPLEIWYFQCWKLITPRMKVLVTLVCLAGGYLEARIETAPHVELPPAVRHRIEGPGGEWVKVKPDGFFAGINDPVSIKWRIGHDARW